MRAAKILYLLIFCSLIFFCSNFSFAHSPHDPIVSFQLSPQFRQDQTVFLIVSNTLEKSSDRGNSWKKLVNGLDNAFPLTALAVSPNFDSDKTLFVASRGDGIYKSQNAGISWKKINDGLHSHNIRFLATFPNNHTNPVVIAADDTGRLYRSENSGKSWDEVFSHKDRITSISFCTSSRQVPVFIGTQDGFVYQSKDAGRSWLQIQVRENCGAISAISISPNYPKDQTIWIGSKKCGVLKSSDGGATFVEKSSGISEKKITSILSTADEQGKVLLYASTWHNALFFSDNGGDNWVKYGDGLTTNSQADEPAFLLPYFKGIAKSDEVLFLGGFDGLFRSKDGGRTWIQLDTVLLSGITGLDVSPPNKDGKQIVAIATYGAGAYLYSEDNKSWLIYNKGLSWPRLNDISFSPSYWKTGTLFSGSENNFLKFNGKAQSWERIPIRFNLKRRLKKRIAHYLRKVKIPVSIINKLYQPLSPDSRFPTFIAPSPNYSADSVVFFGTRSAGIYRHIGSERAEMLWEASQKLVTSLEASPNFSNDKTVFAGIYGQGVFKTTDGGKSWKKTGGESIGHQYVTTAISPDYSHDKTVIAGCSSGLFISSDGGARWKRIGEKDLGKNPNIICLSVSPMFKNDHKIIVSVKGRGLFETQDRGATFHQTAVDLLKDNYEVKYIQFSKQYSKDHKILYCVSSYAFFRSADNGQTWEKVTRPIRYEDMREEVKLHGKWETVSGENHSAMTEAKSNTPGSTAELRFVGTGVTWIGHKSPDGGQAEIFIDGKLVTKVSQRSDAYRPDEAVFSITGLAPGGHHVVLKVCSPGQDTGCGWVSLDAFDVK